MAKRPKRPKRGGWTKGESGNRRGRPKGALNKVTLEIRTISRAMVTDPAYLAKLQSDFRRRKVAPAIEALFWHYGFGKPKETVQIEGGDAPVKFTLMLDTRRALPKLPGGDDE